MVVWKRAGARAISSFIIRISGIPISDAHDLVTGTSTLSRSRSAGAFGSLTIARSREAYDCVMLQNCGALLQAGELKPAHKTIPHEDAAAAQTNPRGPQHVERSKSSSPLKEDVMRAEVERL